MYKSSLTRFYKFHERNLRVCTRACVGTSTDRTVFVTTDFFLEVKKGFVCVKV